MLSDGLVSTGSIPVASGTFADVWRGTYPPSSVVAIKALRIYNNDELRTVQKVCFQGFHEQLADDVGYHQQLFKEVVVWRRLSHPNVLPFLGITATVFRLGVVSEWMPNGHIGQYLTSNPSTNRLPLASPTSFI